MTASKILNSLKSAVDEKFWAGIDDALSVYDDELINRALTASVVSNMVANGLTREKLFDFLADFEENEFWRKEEDSYRDLMSIRKTEFEAYLKAQQVKCENAKKKHPSAFVDAQGKLRYIKGRKTELNEEEIKQITKAERYHVAIEYGSKF